MKRFLALVCVIWMLLSVVIAEESNRVEPASDRKPLIELPENLTYIAEDAFEEVEDATFAVWRGSYAHTWCMKNGVRYVILDDFAPVDVNQVFSVEVAENEDGEDVIRCVVTTAENCYLRVDVMDDDGKILINTDQTEVMGQKSNLTVDIAPSKPLAKYFTLRAVLEDKSGNELCEARINHHYTSEYEAFLNQKPEDFPKQTVIDYGSSGFAVMSEDVIAINAPASFAGNGYTFLTDQALSAGDMVLLNVHGEQTPVKIASVKKNTDGTVTVIRDENVYLSDMYDLIKVEGICGGRGGESGDEPEDISPAGTITFESVTVGYSLDIDVWAKFDYDKEREYFETEVNVVIGGRMTAFFGDKIDTWEDNNSPEIVLYDSDIMIPFIEDPASLKVSLPLNIFAEVGGTATIDMMYHYGYNYNPVSGWTSIVGRTATPTVDVAGKFSMKFGPEVSLNLNLFRAVTGRLGGQAGILLEGKTETPFYSGSLESQGGAISKYHACYGCIDMDYFFDINVRGTLNYNISEKLSGSLIDVNVGLYKVKMGDLYYSVHNDPNSIHEGKSKFGMGECPNYLYRTTIVTENLEGDTVENIPLVLTGNKLTDVDKMLKAQSPMTTYLYPGIYLAEAGFETGNVEKMVQIESASQVVSIQEEQVIVEGVVTDENTHAPISGASVMLTLPDGGRKIAITGNDGRYRFEKLSAGVYTISASAPEYMTETISKLNFFAGSRQNISFELGAFMPDKEIVMKLMAYLGEDMIQKLKDAEFNATMSFTYYTSGYGDAILEYGWSLRVDYPIYAQNKGLYKEYELAVIESDIFPLTEAQTAEITYKIQKAKGVDIDVEYSNGFSAWGGMPINDVLIQFRYEPEINQNLYTKKWTSSWQWDEMLSDSGR